MSDTQVVIDQERVPTAEGELPRTGQGPAGQPSSSNSKLASPSVSALKAIESVNDNAEPRTESRTMALPGPGDGSPPKRGIATSALIFLFDAARVVAILLFKALREVYWALDRDAKVRSQGLQTVGRVVATKTEKHEDPESGTYYTHSVSYDFEVDARTHTASKNVGALGDLKRGVPIRVYYLPGTYPPDSALDTEPRALGRAIKREHGAELGPNRG